MIRRGRLRPLRDVIYMNKTSTPNNSSTTTNETVADRLPEMNEEDISFAKSHQQLAWCHGFMDNHSNGHTYYMKDHGIHLQRVSESESRCVAIVDHPYCYATLAWLEISFEKAGITLQVDPYAVVIPYDPPEEEDERESEDEGTGMEVA